MNLPLRTLAIAILTGSAIFWMLFGVTEYPWIVPADGVGSSAAKAAERVSFAGASLFVLSLIAIWLPTGMFGRGNLLLGVSGAILLGWLLVFPWLYPNWSLHDYAWRLAAHALGLMALLMGTAATYRRG